MNVHDSKQVQNLTCNNMIGQVYIRKILQGQGKIPLEQECRNNSNSEHANSSSRRKIGQYIPECWETWCSSTASTHFSFSPHLRQTKVEQLLL